MSTNLANNESQWAKECSGFFEAEKVVAIGQASIAVAKLLQPFSCPDRKEIRKQVYTILRMDNDSQG